MQKFLTVRGQRKVKKIITHLKEAELAEWDRVFLLSYVWDELGKNLDFNGGDLNKFMRVMLCHYIVDQLGAKKKTKTSMWETFPIWGAVR